MRGLSAAQRRTWPVGKTGLTCAPLCRYISARSRRTEAEWIVLGDRKGPALRPAPSIESFPLDARGPRVSG